ncbi:ABC transporter ATP-binding protein [Spirochaeta isovalerica]|uniref:Iron complex transport system ATP-binding protein n=1 Tax=Spirochaeta isovalerica TaxID=150 RepID=A0A841RE44_9SPIO|nr:ABC transporter ATP-binding protein [Spirochaeta isovalerica]MBB6481487.1 iron complex transport system ATP-binding protein [Spirochaeta isovalerica]
MTDPIVKLDQIRFHYSGGERDVLRQLSLEIRKGDIVAILGPNGVGKTTLLHLILGWLKPEEGSISVNGKPISEYGRKEMGKMTGLVPQDEHITFDYSLLEYVLHGRYPHLKSLEAPGPEDRIIALESLKRVGMDTLAERPVTHLSGGEKQLVLIARSLTQEPSVVLLDEPMSNLDIANKRMIINVLRSLKKEGVTILFTTHEPEIAATLCDSVILMGRDKHIEQGPADAILTGDALSRIYEIPVDIVSHDGRKIIMWY